MLSKAQTVDIGHGRGRLAPASAASVARIDAQLGRPADINSAWRDPVLQQQLYDAWVAYSRYLAGGPWAPKAPRALPPRDSVHCDGEAADSDDWYDARAAAVWRDNGWRQTARTNNATTDEPWHGEYFLEHDNHRNDTAVQEAAPFNPLQEEDMNGEPFEIEHNGDLFVAAGQPRGGIVHLTPVSIDILSGGTTSPGYWNLTRTDEKGKTVDAGPLIAPGSLRRFNTHGNQTAFDELVRIYQR